MSSSRPKYEFTKHVFNNPIPENRLVRQNSSSQVTYDNSIHNESVEDMSMELTLDGLNKKVQNMEVVSTTSTLENSTSYDVNPKDIEGNKKPPLSLVPSSAILGMAMAFKEGARKYGAYNWRTKKVQAMIYIEAAQRHILQKLDGEDIDPESGVDHLDAAMASLAVYKDAQETGNLIDNRPTKGSAGNIIRRIGGKNEL